MRYNGLNRLLRASQKNKKYIKLYENGYHKNTIMLKQKS